MRNAAGGKTARRRGFTLVELLVVISLIGMLLALLLPAVQQAREASRRNTCSNNLRNCTVAVLNFESAKRQYPGYREPLEVTIPGTSGPTKIPVSWVVVMLPYLERTDVYDLWRNAQQAADAGISWPPQVSLDVLNCPSSPAASASQSPCIYVVNSGMSDQYPKTVGATSELYPADFQANGIFFNHVFQVNGANVAPFMSWPCVPPLIYTSQSYVTANDGSSLTMLASENNNVPSFSPVAVAPSGLSGGPTSWGDPATSANEKRDCFIWWPDKNPNPDVKINAVDRSSINYGFFRHPASAHPGGVNVSFCDGHVRSVSDSIDYGVFCLLMTPCGAQCNTPGTVGGLDGAGGTPLVPTSQYYTTSNYPYLRTALIDDSNVP